MQHTLVNWASSTFCVTFPRMWSSNVQRVCCSSWSQWALQVQSHSEHQAGFCGWVLFYPLFDNKHYKKCTEILLPWKLVEFCHWTLCRRSSGGWIYSHLRCLPGGELQGWLGMTASISVWGTERRADLWMNPDLQGSLNGLHASLGNRPQLTGFTWTTSTYLSHLPPCWC